MEDTSFGSRIVVTAVKIAAAEAEQEANGERELEETNATNAARQKANELGIHLMGLEGTGYGGLSSERRVTERDERISL